MKYKILCIFFLLSTSLQSQNIKEFLSYINYLDQENQVISYDFIRKSGPVGLADVILGHGLVQRKNNDTLGAFHNILINYEDGGINQQIYNGKNVIKISMEDQFCVVINPDSFNFAYNLITESIYNSLKPNFLYNNKYFNSLLYNDNIENLKFDTIEIFGRNCLQLKIKYFDTRDMKNSNSYYYFDS